MDIVRNFVVEVPVTIEAADDQSLAAAKAYLKKFFYRMETGANAENLVFTVRVDKARLTHRDN